MGFVKNLYINCTKLSLIHIWLQIYILEYTYGKFDFHAPVNAQLYADMTVLFFKGNIHAVQKHQQENINKLAEWLKSTVLNPKQMYIKKT